MSSIIIFDFELLAESAVENFLFYYYHHHHCDSYWYFYQYRYHCNILIIFTMIMSFTINVDYNSITFFLFFLSKKVIFDQNMISFIAINIFHSSDTSYVFINIRTYDKKKLLFFHNYYEICSWFHMSIFYFKSLINIRVLLSIVIAATIFILILVIKSTVIDVHII